MKKKLELVFTDKDKADIFIDFETGSSIFSGLQLSQSKSATEVWNRFTKEDVELPKRRYALSTEKGKQELLDDLDYLGLAGQHYHIEHALNDAEPFGTEDEDLEEQLLNCYEDYIDLGWYCDLDAVREDVEELQRASDEEAKKILEAHGYGKKIKGGPCYLNHVWSDDEDEWF